MLKCFWGEQKENKCGKMLTIGECTCRIYRCFLYYFNFSCRCGKSSNWKFWGKLPKIQWWLRSTLIAPWSLYCCVSIIITHLSINWPKWFGFIEEIYMMIDLSFDRCLGALCSLPGSGKQEASLWPCSDRSVFSSRFW